MYEQLTAAFRAYRDRGRRPDGGPLRYEVEVRRLSEDERTIEVALTFKAGIRYCCAEPGCNFGLVFEREWRILRDCLSAKGVRVGSPLTVIIHGTVEKGALLESGPQLGLPLESPGYTYEHASTEPPSEDSASMAASHGRE